MGKPADGKVMVGIYLPKTLVERLHRKAVAEGRRISALVEQALHLFLGDRR